MLYTRITREQHAALSDELKGEYKADGDSFVLQLSGTTAREADLQSQLNRSITDLNSANHNLLQAEAKLKTVAETSTAEVNAKLEAVTKERDTLRGDAQKSAIKAVIDPIASKFTSPELFDPVLKSRVTAEYDAKGELQVKIVNDKGEAITQEQLTKEFVDNKAYSALLAKPASTPSIVSTPTNPSTPIFNQGAGTSGFNQEQNTDKMREVNGKLEIVNHASMTSADWAAWAESQVPDDAKTN